MLTPDQIRMARAGLGLNMRELAADADVHVMTLCRCEGGAGTLSATLAKIERALRDAGAEFADDADGTVSVTICPRE